MREHSATSLGIGIASALGNAIWGFLLAVMLWTSVAIYAVVKWIGSPTDHPSPTTLLVIVVGIVSFFPLALAVGTYAVGRSMRPAKRNDRQEALPG
jgi:hypothetical protein